MWGHAADTYRNHLEGIRKIPDSYLAFRIPNQNGAYVLQLISMVLMYSVHEVAYCVRQLFNLSFCLQRQTLSL